MTTTTRPCAKPTCSQDATHGVYFLPSKRWWIITNNTHLPAKAPIRYCRWHATVLATCRNAARREMAYIPQPGRERGSDAPRSS